MRTFGGLGLAEGVRTKMVMLKRVRMKGYPNESKNLGLSTAI